MPDKKPTAQAAAPKGPAVHAYVLRELAMPATAVEGELPAAIAAFLRLKRSRIGAVRILRKSLDSRKRNQPLWRYTVEFAYDGELKHPRVTVAGAAGAIAPGPGAASRETATPGAPGSPTPSFRPSGRRVAVIGSGPAGMAAAMGLIRKGYQVTVYEQGSDVSKRFGDIRRFLKGNVFHPHSNILFGEGGAGTFSDGKLTCRTRNRYTEAFLNELVASGAPADTLYLSHPHIGTDKLQFIVKAWRERCIALGCVFRFNTAVDGIVADKGRITGVTVGGATESCDALVLAAGHSSRPLYRALAALGVAMDRKPFSVGVRVEHPQELVNRRQLGERVDPGVTGAAEYFLTWNAEDQSMSAYSFCMCPGGVVVPCADSEDALFTNGMSYSNRAGAFANSAVVVPVTPADLDGWKPSASADPLAGLDYIRELEIKAFALGGGDFTFPAQTIAAYLEDRVDEGPLPRTSFPKPVRWANLRGLFPAKVARALEESFRNFERKLPGFISEGLIIGPESRTSSPVRILRHAESLESLSTPGLFPLGEGAGYSGGIVSSGADGFRLAEGWEPWSGTTAPAAAPSATASATSTAKTSRTAAAGSGGG